jgi:hypothetical protein
MMTEIVKTDRRIQKTKKALTESLIHLILEKGYEKVTVQDILDRANVGRSTFYLHYESKEKLMLDGHNNLDTSYFNIVIEGQINFQEFITNLSQAHKVAKAILGNKSGQMFTLLYRNKITQQLRKFYGNSYSKGRNDQRILRYSSDAASSAVMNLIVSWIEDDMPNSTNDIATFAKNIIESIMKIHTKD